MNSETILVVEDETSIRTVLRTYLENAHFNVVVIDDGAAALEVARQVDPALIILDLNLPGMDGMEVAARLRQESDVYLLMLSARSEESDRVAGLRLGADDYVTKPFSPRELVARVEAILRRRRESPAVGRSGARLASKRVTVDAARHEAHADGEPLDLTATEFKVLQVLVTHQGHVLTRDQLINQVWGVDYYGTARVVDVYVGQVRRKLEQATGASLIQTVRGVGYKFVDEA